MKYLVIDGCPRRGNTWKIYELVKANIKKENKNAEFDEIHLINEDLAFCYGCSNCFRNGHEKCPHAKTVIKIMQAIENADGVIFISTTYNMRETSILKNLFDHLCFMLHRPYFFNSKALIITSTGGVGAKKAAKGIASFLEGIGFNKCHIFSTATLSWNAYNIDAKTKSKIKKTTLKFYKDILSKKMHSPACLLLIPYNLFRGMSLAYVKGTEFETQDGEYWTCESRKRGVYDASVSVPFYKRPIGHIFYFIGKFAGRKIIVTYKK